MNAFTLAIASIRSRPLHTALCIGSVAVGIALLCAVFLLSQNLASGFTRNAKNIDIIVGAKGSPLQLVLSSVYHADIPAGNIDMHDYETLRRNPKIRQAIPLALGDNYRGFRMVGTTPEYIALYNGEFAQGEMFKEGLETVAGSRTGLDVGDKFYLTHGFSTDSDNVHRDNLYIVTGVLKPTGTVLDKLFVTDYKNVQQAHAHHGHHNGEVHKEDKHTHDEHNHNHDGHKKDNHKNHIQDNDLANQITSIILRVRSPIDLINLPRLININSNVMAAVPSYEIARFSKSLGIGRQLVIVLGAGFVILSALILFATLSSGLALRRYDLAVLRVLGATPRRLSNTVIAEALLISGVGALLGVVIGHISAYLIVNSIQGLNGFIVAENPLLPRTMDLGFILLGLFIGLCASLLPSLSAARTDIATLLARGRM